VKRAIAVLAVLALTAVGAALAYQTAARQRDYRAALTRGDNALRDDQTFAAIEAYSGAIELRPDSMPPTAAARPTSGAATAAISNRQRATSAQPRASIRRRRGRSRRSATSSSSRNNTTGPSRRTSAARGLTTDRRA
jgi:hypothetical protein